MLMSSEKRTCFIIVVGDVFSLPAYEEERLRSLNSTISLLPFVAAFVIMMKDTPEYCNYVPVQYFTYCGWMNHLKNKEKTAALMVPVL